MAVYEMRLEDARRRFKAVYDIKEGVKPEEAKVVDKKVEGESENILGEKKEETNGATTLEVCDKANWKLHFEPMCV